MKILFEEKGNIWKNIKSSSQRHVYYGVSFRGRHFVRPLTNFLCYFTLFVYFHCQFPVYDKM